MVEEKTMVHVIPMTEAKRELSKLVGRLRKDPELVFTVTLRGHPVAGLKAAPQGAVPGLAAHKLVELITRLPKPRGRTRTNTSSKVKRSLYGRGGAVN
jgi:antitoxin (DNA-binding transcriptional repressor) of toxin-antitoxin stability system